MGQWLDSEAGWESHSGGKGGCMEVGARGWDCMGWGGCTGVGGLHRVGVRGLHCGGRSAGGHGLGPLEGDESPAFWAVAPWLESQPLQVVCSGRKGGGSAHL